MTRHNVFTSESVAAGHPDKIADTISDAVLDFVLQQNPQAHVACEALVTDGLVVVAGEIEWDAAQWHVLEAAIAVQVRQVLDGLGHAADTFELRIQVGQQSADIRRGVRQADGATGAGDQGQMFGYACNETATLMPLPISLAHALMQRHGALRQSGALPWLGADAKAQVVVRYEDGQPVRVEEVLLSTQHAVGMDTGAVHRAVVSEMITPVLTGQPGAADIRYRVNPTGVFETGGPAGDTGLTGRKIVVDTYGGACPHGGGAFSGKDPTKVDRSAAYMARYVAKNIVAAGLADRCTLQLAYAIGVVEPVSVFVDLHATGHVEEALLEHAIREVFDLTPAGIIETLDLRRPIYRRTAVYGHFGREDRDFTWERTDRTDALRSALG